MSTEKTLARLRADGFDIQVPRRYEAPGKLRDVYVAELSRLIRHRDIDDWQVPTDRDQHRAQVAAKADAGLPSATRHVDPSGTETASRASRGANSAVKSPGTMPDLEGASLMTLKSIALSIGAYNAAVRPRLATALLDALRAQGADRIADMYQRVWSDPETGISQPSDLEVEKAGDAHSDAAGGSHAAMRKIAKALSQAALAAPSRRGRAR